MPSPPISAKGDKQGVQTSTPVRKEGGAPTLQWGSVGEGPAGSWDFYPLQAVRLPPLRCGGKGDHKGQASTSTSSPSNEEPSAPLLGMMSEKVRGGQDFYHLPVGMRSPK